MVKSNQVKMDINHIIIHELYKEGGAVGAKLTTYSSVIDNKDLRVIKLVNEINNRYKNRNETYGVFDSANATEFHSAFNTYFEAGLKEKEFIEFSKSASKDLETRIDSNAPAKGGYLIFVNYKANRHFVGVFLVRNTLGLSFTKIDDKKEFNIDDVQHVDFENLAMACRINIEAYSKTEIRYLSFINTKADEMSKYFTRWISSCDTETNKEDTQKFFDLICAVESPVDEKTKEKINKVELLDRIHKYVLSVPGRMINVRDISNSFYGDPNYLSTELERLEMQMNGEFKAHSTVFKKFVEIKASADQVELSFPHSVYKTIVRFDENDKSQIIIKSEKLASKIHDMIKNA